MKYGWSTEMIHMEMKEEWKPALKETGEQFAIIHGIIEMLKLYADNSGLAQQVEYHCFFFFVATCIVLLVKRKLDSLFLNATM